RQWDRVATAHESRVRELLAAASPLLPRAAVAVASTDLELASEPGPEAGVRTFCDALVHALTGGGLLRLLPLHPTRFTPEQREFVARLLAWQREHAGVLHTSRLLPGTPRAGEVHGAAWAAGQAAIVFLRNPAPVATDAALQIGELFQASAAWP